MIEKLKNEICDNRRHASIEKRQIKISAEEEEILIDILYGRSLYKAKGNGL